MIDGEQHRSSTIGHIKMTSKNLKLAQSRRWTPSGVGHPAPTGGGRGSARAIRTRPLTRKPNTAQGGSSLKRIRRRQAAVDEKRKNGGNLFVILHFLLAVQATIGHARTLQRDRSAWGQLVPEDGTATTTTRVGTDKGIYSGGTAGKGLS